jgi:hypothetical protein
LHSTTRRLPKTAGKAFSSDFRKDIILAQQRTLDLAPYAPMLAMRMDTALASFRAMVERAIAKERGEPAERAY